MLRRRMWCWFEVAVVESGWAAVLLLVGVVVVAAARRSVWEYARRRAA